MGYLRWTPQAFSHFTFDASAGQQLIVDIQGVGDLYTDPAVHSADQQGFGSGNMGPDGMLSFFLTHQCTALCQSFGLQPFRLFDAEKPDIRVCVDPVAASSEAAVCATSDEMQRDENGKTGQSFAGSRSSAFSKDTAETLGVEVLARVGSCGEGLVSSAADCGSRQNHKGVDEAFGRLHTTLALH